MDSSDALSRSRYRERRLISDITLFPVELGHFIYWVPIMELLKIFTQNLHIYCRNVSASACIIHFVYILVLYSKSLAGCSLGPLVNKVKDVQVETIVDTLCSNMLSEKEQLRDISSIGKLKYSAILHLLGLVKRMRFNIFLNQSQVWKIRKGTWHKTE